MNSPTPTQSSSDLIRISTQFHLKENRGPIVRGMINLIIHTNTPQEAFELIPDVFRFMPCDECKGHAAHNRGLITSKFKNAIQGSDEQGSTLSNLTTEDLVMLIIDIQNKIILHKHLENGTKPDRRDNNTRHGIRDLQGYIDFRS